MEKNIGEIEKIVHKQIKKIRKLNEKELNEKELISVQKEIKEQLEQAELMYHSLENYVLYGFLKGVDEYEISSEVKKVKKLMEEYCTLLEEMYEKKYGKPYEESAE